MPKATEFIVGTAFELNGCPVRIVEATTKKVKLAIGRGGEDHRFRMLKPGEMLDFADSEAVD